MNLSLCALGAEESVPLLLERLRAGGCPTERDGVGPHAEGLLLLVGTGHFDAYDLEEAQSALQEARKTTIPVILCLREELNTALQLGLRGEPTGAKPSQASAGGPESAAEAPSLGQPERDGLREVLKVAQTMARAQFGMQLTWQGPDTLAEQLLARLPVRSRYGALPRSHCFALLRPSVARPGERTPCGEIPQPPACLTAVLPDGCGLFSQGSSDIDQHYWVQTEDSLAAVAMAKDIAERFLRQDGAWVFWHRHPLGEAAGAQLNTLDAIGLGTSNIRPMRSPELPGLLHAQLRRPQLWVVEFPAEATEAAPGWQNAAPNACAVVLSTEPPPKGWVKLPISRPSLAAPETPLGKLQRTLGGGLSAIHLSNRLCSRAGLSPEDLHVALTAAGAAGQPSPRQAALNELVRLSTVSLSADARLLLSLAGLVPEATLPLSTIELLFGRLDGQNPDGKRGQRAANELAEAGFAWIRNVANLAAERPREGVQFIQPCAGIGARTLQTAEGGPRAEPPGCLPLWRSLLEELTTGYDTLWERESLPQIQVMTRLAAKTGASLPRLAVWTTQILQAHGYHTSALLSTIALYEQRQFFPDGAERNLLVRINGPMLRDESVRETPEDVDRVIELLHLAGEIWGQEHPDYFALRMVWARMLAFDGKEKSAANASREIFEARMRLFEGDAAGQVEAALEHIAMLNLICHSADAGEVAGQLLPMVEAHFGAESQPVHWVRRFRVKALPQKEREGELKTLLAQAEGWEGKDSPSLLGLQAELINEIGQHSPMEARKWLESRLSVVQATQGDRHPSTLDLAVRLAMVLDELGRPAEGRNLLIRFTAEMAEHPYATCEESARALEALAILRIRLGDVAKARLSAMAAWEIWRRLEGARGLNKLRAQGFAANICMRLGDHAEAAMLLERVIANGRQLEGALADELPVHIENHGSSLLALGRYEEALVPLKEAWLLAREREGANSANAQSLAQGVAAALRGAKRNEEARELLFQEWDRIQQKEGPDSVLAIMAELQLHCHQAESERSSEAVGEIERITRHLTQTLGQEAPDTLQALAMLRFVLLQTGGYARAREISRQRYEHFRKRQGPDAEVSLIALHEEAECALKLQDWLGARRCLEEVVDGFNRRLGSTHLRTLRASLELSVALRKLGKNIPDRVTRVLDELARAPEERSSTEEVRSIRNQYIQLIGINKGSVLATPSPRAAASRLMKAPVTSPLAGAEATNLDDFGRKPLVDTRMDAVERAEALVALPPGEVSTEALVDAVGGLLNRAARRAAKLKGPNRR